MGDKSTRQTAKASHANRILNEFSVKILNEQRLEKVIESRRTSRLSPHSDTSFLCECGNKDCAATIMMSTEEYERVHRKADYFIVLPGHVNQDLDKVITSFNNFTLVVKYFSGANGND